jgi:hypothetical protein
VKERRGTEQLPARQLPRAVVSAWARGPAGAPAGRTGKKFRRRARRLAGVLAALLVLQSTGPAVAETSFYKASPYVSTTELIAAGSRTFEESLAASPGMREPAGPALASTTLEKAIVSGALSPGNIELPDMMLAGIAGDEMAQSGSGSDGGEESGGVPAPGHTDGEGRSSGTIAEVAKEVADGNEKGYSSPSLGGDPEPIEEAYAERDVGSDAVSDNAAPVPTSEPPGELASAEPAPTISDSGPPEPTAPPPSSHGASGEISDELALGLPESGSSEGVTTTQQTQALQPQAPEQSQAPEQAQTAQQAPPSEPSSQGTEQAFAAPPDSSEADEPAPATYETPTAAEPSPPAQDESEGSQNGVSDELAVAPPSGDGAESTDESTYEGSSGEDSPGQSSGTSSPETSAVGAVVDAAQEQAVGEHAASGEDAPAASPFGKPQTSEVPPIPEKEESSGSPGEPEGTGQPSGRDDGSGHAELAGGQPGGQEDPAPPDRHGSRPTQDAVRDGRGAAEPPATSDDAVPDAERGERSTSDSADGRTADISPQSGTASPDEQKSADEDRAPAGPIGEEGASTEPQNTRPPAHDRADGGSGRDHNSGIPEDKGGSTHGRRDPGRETGHDGERDRERRGGHRGDRHGGHYSRKDHHATPTAGAGPAKIFVEGNGTSSTIERRQGGDKKVLFEGKIPFDDAVGLAKERFGAAPLRDQGDGSPRSASGRAGYADGRSNEDASPAPGPEGNRSADGSAPPTAAPNQRFADVTEPSAGGKPGRRADVVDNSGAGRQDLVPRDSREPEAACDEHGHATPTSVPQGNAEDSRHTDNANGVSDELDAGEDGRDAPVRSTGRAARDADVGSQERSGTAPATVRLERDAATERARAAAVRRAEQRAERQATREAAQRGAAARETALRAAHRAELRAQRQEERAAQATVEVADGAGPGVRPEAAFPVVEPSATTPTGGS